jgi:hypothetical protein
MLQEITILYIVYVSMVAGQGSVLPASNQVCLIVPQDVELCYRNFQGKPIEDKAAQVNCLQVNGLLFTGNWFIVYTGNWFIAYTGKGSLFTGN